jgi:hypothetical protein
MNTRACFLLACALWLAGCTSFTGVKPVFPEVGNPNYPSAIDTLRPTFEWQAAPGADSYDLIVYEGIKDESFWEGTKRAVGPEVYYREALPSNRHTIEQDLAPGTEYYWSVRVRKGGKASEWSNYDYTLFLGTAYMHAGNRFFVFHTPEKR